MSRAARWNVFDRCGERSVPLFCWWLWAMKIDVCPYLVLAAAVCTALLLWTRYRTNNTIQCELTPSSCPAAAAAPTQQAQAARRKILVEGTSVTVSSPTTFGCHEDCLSSFSQQALQPAKICPVILADCVHPHCARVSGKQIGGISALTRVNNV